MESLVEEIAEEQKMFDSVFGKKWMTAHIRKSIQSDVLVLFLCCGTCQMLSHWSCGGVNLPVGQNLTQILATVTNNEM